MNYVHKKTMKIINKIIIIIIAVIGLYATFLIASDINTISDKISSFKIEFLPIIISLVTCSWFVTVCLDGIYY